MKDSNSRPRMTRLKLLFLAVLAISPMANKENLDKLQVGLDLLRSLRLSGETSAEVAVRTLRRNLNRTQRFLLYVSFSSWLRAFREITPFPATR
jgi:hypothetical protein